MMKSSLTILQAEDTHKVLSLSNDCIAETLSNSENFKSSLVNVAVLHFEKLSKKC